MDAVGDVGVGFVVEFARKVGEEGQSQLGEDLEAGGIVEEGSDLSLLPQVHRE